MSKYDPIECIGKNETLNTYVSPIDTNKISCNIAQNNLSLSLKGQGFSPLLIIRPDGTVTAESIENSCLAGKMFVESIRQHILPGNEINEEDFVNDEFLNKTEDLHLLSKIIDDINNGNNIKKAVSLISSARKADRKRIEDLEKALDFYADPETYHGCSFMFDRPTGGFDEDFSNNHGHEDYDRPMPGQKARDVLSGDLSCPDTNASQ